MNEAIEKINGKIDLSERAVKLATDHYNDAVRMAENSKKRLIEVTLRLKATQEAKLIIEEVTDVNLPE